MPWTPAAELGLRSLMQRLGQTGNLAHLYFAALLQLSDRYEAVVGRRHFGMGSASLDA
jgi:hypothetical protein